MTDAIEKVLIMLDNFRISDEITYFAYSALYDEISLLNDLPNEQEAVEPREQEETRAWIVCGNCSQHLISKWLWCPYCGRKVKWDD